MSVAGVVLAAGRSSRFKGSKCLALLEGRPLAAHPLGALAKVADELLLCVPPETEDEFTSFRAWAGNRPLRVEGDLRPGRGPLGGLETALTLLASPTVLLAGCDQPRIRPAVLQALLDAASGHDAICFEVEETVQPLPALYKRGCLPELKYLLKEPTSGLTDLLVGVEAKVLPESEARRVDEGLLSFRSVNTPEDLGAF